MTFCGFRVIESLHCADRNCKTFAEMLLANREIKQCKK